MQHGLRFGLPIRLVAALHDIAVTEGSMRMAQPGSRLRRGTLTPIHKARRMRVA